MIFSQNLFRRPTPALSRNWESISLCWGPHPNLHYRKLTFRQLLC